MCLRKYCISFMISMVLSVKRSLNCDNSLSNAGIYAFEWLLWILNPLITWFLSRHRPTLYHSRSFHSKTWLNVMFHSIMLACFSNSVQCTSSNSRCFRNCSMPWISDTATAKSHATPYSNRDTGPVMRNMLLSMNRQTMKPKSCKRFNKPLALLTVAASLPGKTSRFSNAVNTAS
jgi:hypothetical protein